MVPLIELRGAIPIGVGLGLPLWQVYIISIIGNMIPVPFIFFLARRVLEWGADKPVIGKFFTFCLEKGHKGGEKLKAKAGRGLPWALLLFVGYPPAGHRCLDRHTGRQPAGHGFQIQRACLHGRRAAGRVHHGCGQFAGLLGLWCDCRVIFNNSTIIKGCKE